MRRRPSLQELRKGPVSALLVLAHLALLGGSVKAAVKTLAAGDPLQPDQAESFNLPDCLKLKPSLFAQVTGASPRAAADFHFRLCSRSRLIDEVWAPVN